MRFKFGVFLIGILLVSFVSGLIIEEEAISNLVVPDINHPAHFKLKFFGATPGGYNVYTLTDVKILPTSVFILDAFNTEIDVYVYPTENLKDRGLYAFSYVLREVNGRDFKDKLTVRVVDFVDVVKISSGSNEPDSGKMKFYVENLEDVKFENVKMKFSSIFFDFEEEFDLEALGRKEFEVNVEKEEVRTIAAGSYLLKAEIETGDGKKEIVGKIYLGEKKGVEGSDVVSGFFVKSREIVKENIGNTDEIIDVKINKNIFTRLFTSFDVEPDVVSREGVFVEYSWNRRLEPSDVFEVNIKTNYFFSLFILIVAVFLIWGFGKYTKTRVYVRKSVSHVKTKSGHFALKIRLRVRARKNVANVSLVDRIPAMVKVYEKFGLIKPDKIDASTRRIQWNLGDLGEGEERIVAYIVYSKVGVVGKFELPSALVIYEEGDKIHELQSNRVFFLSEQISGED